MGAVGSTIFGHVKRYAYRYNAEFRSQKFIEKGNLPRAPRHPTHQKIDTDKLLQENPDLQKKFEELNKKNEQLNEYLKKVYLTSNKVEEVQYKKPLPVKTESPSVLFLEPTNTNIGNITLTTFMKILLDHQGDPKKWTASALSSKYAIDKKDLVNVLTYYTLYRQEKFDFMRVDGPQLENDDTETKKVEFEVLKRISHKLHKQIRDK